ncbi:aryl-alcohol-oxidase from pleurotus Eryingii [Dendrothele bispora CBS 962.96]|uniref:Aryl-alcohol-oxidase from pleurotus Eryingii n=1 Tax=Dendrothele bispora (strain CBS 962.96) TaxID=1314807 RepID=A0A4S8M4T5_DENBC|nr:aryl-alcohol-oxidase from pleurotus Eryingii [Dendrothele bispora CBS 962.96]
MGSLQNWRYTALLPTLISFAGATGILTNSSDLRTTEFDFVVVGGGTAGNVIANRLTENPAFSVLVIEAGGSDRDTLELMAPGFAPLIAPNTQWDWNLTTTPQAALNNRSVSVARGFVLGGSSTINFLAYTRGTSNDFDRYAEITGDDGWSWDRLMPYIFKNEHFMIGESESLENQTARFNPSVHGFTGALPVSLADLSHEIDAKVIDTTTEMSEDYPFNQDMNSGNHLGLGWVQATVENGTRSSSATVYLSDQFLQRPNLQVLVNARVTRVLQSNTTNCTSPTFDQVEFTQDGGASVQVISARKEIILSAGSIMSPHILMHSGIGDPNALFEVGIEPIHNLSSVGQNLTEHPFLSSAWQTLNDWSETRSGPLSHPPLSFMAWLRLPDNSSIFESFKDPAAGPNTAHYELFWINGKVGPEPAQGNFLTLGSVVVAPTSRGAVTLNSSDPLDPPLINFNLLSSDFDMFVQREAFRSAKKFLTGSACSSFIVAAPTNATTDEELDTFIRQNALGVFHPVSTAAMSGKNATWGVVDPDLRVKGVSGLRVVDSSVMPIIPAAHTQAPTYIIAERAADMIKEAWFGVV